MRIKTTNTKEKVGTSRGRLGSRENLRTRIGSFKQKILEANRFVGFLY